MAVALLVMVVILAVAIGITADSFIVYFERIKDELRALLGPDVQLIDTGAPVARQTRRLLAQAGLPPDALELELTEGVAVADPRAAMTTMQQLRARGVHLSMDDFGTGYSSLSQLKHFQLYKLKIDQSFVRDLEHDSNDRAIVSAIIRMAQALGLQTTAEGVETAAQLQFLREQGCDEAQGYHFSPPQAAGQIEAFLQQRCV